MSGERIEGRNANDYNIQQLVPVLPLCTVWECHLPPRGEPLTAKEEAYFSLTSRPDWKISNDRSENQITWKANFSMLAYNLIFL